MKGRIERVIGAGWTMAGLAGAVGLLLLAVGAYDYAATRTELTNLVRAQAASVRDTVAAAARANQAAADDAQTALVARLLENARLLAEIDRRGPLTPEFLEAMAARHHLFRVTVFDSDGTRAQFIVPPGTRPGGQGSAHAPWAGGPERGALVDRLIADGEPEAVTDLHAARAGGARVSAGARRAGGGAIILSVDASDIERMHAQSALDRLLAEVVLGTMDVAYLAFEHSGRVHTAGHVPADLGDHLAVPPAAVAAGSWASEEREIEVGGRPVLELTGPIDLAGTADAHLHLGMRLDSLRRAERRTLARLALSLPVAVALGVMGVGLLWIRERYGVLSAEHARAQEALRRRDRLAAMGEMASTVAHEIRNPLNAIAMSAQRLSREGFDDAYGAEASAVGEARQLVGVIMQEAQRINERVQEFLEFARPPRLVPRDTALGPFLDAVVTALTPQAEARGLVLAADTSRAGNATVDPNQLRQALDNIVRNALDATPPGGSVAVSATSLPREHVIEVRDTGEGIPADTLPKIFDLYFTSKPGGTGIGLAVTQQIVAAHGGSIEVESEVGRGTCLRVRLPATAPASHV